MATRGLGRPHTTLGHLQWERWQKATLTGTRVGLRRGGGRQSSEAGLDCPTPQYLALTTCQERGCGEGPALFSSSSWSNGREGQSGRCLKALKCQPEKPVLLPVGGGGRAREVPGREIMASLALSGTQRQAFFHVLHEPPSLLLWSHPWAPLRAVCSATLKFLQMHQAPSYLHARNTHDTRHTYECT